MFLLSPLKPRRPEKMKEETQKVIRAFALFLGVGVCSFCDYALSRLDNTHKQTVTAYCAVHAMICSMVLLASATAAAAATASGMGSPVLETPVLPNPSPPSTPPKPLIVVCVDGLTARHAFESNSYHSLTRQSAYTFRARVDEHTRSNEGWASAFRGGYNSERSIGPNNPPLFAHIRKVSHGLSLYVISSYSSFTEDVGGDYADYTNYIYNSSNVVTNFAQVVSERRNGILPDVSVLYFMEVDATGHSDSWDSSAYTSAVEHSGEQIHRLNYYYPEAQMIITSDHGGARSGHSYHGRDMKNPSTNIDSPYFRDVPFFVFPDDRPRPLCDAIRISDVAWMIADHLGIELHPSWERRSGWLDGEGCTPDMVTPTDASVPVVSKLTLIVVSLYACLIA